MTFRILFVLAAGLALAACEPERGSGFTGIGTKGAESVPGLDFPGLGDADGASGDY